VSSSVFEPERSAARVRHPFTGPARWVAAGLLVAGPLLQVIEFLLESPLDDTAARVAYWAAHPTRIGLSMAVGLLAVPFLIGEFAVLVALSRERARRLAWAAAALLTLAMAGLAAVHGAEMIAYGLARSGNQAAAVAALEGSDVGLPGAVLFVMFLGGAALGILALAAALWRSPLVPRIAPVLIVGFAVLDFALRQPVLGHLVALAGSVVVAGAVVTRYARHSR